MRILQGRDTTEKDLKLSLMRDLLLQYMKGGCMVRPDLSSQLLK